MTTEKINKILAGEEELIPSSGFLSSVMQRIEDEAAAPPPIPFPWRRFVPGVAMAAGVFGWGVVEVARVAASTAGGMSLSAVHLNWTPGHWVEQAGWVALALGASLVSWVLAKRMAGRSGLL
jgi:hypothetical protein